MNPSHQMCLDMRDAWIQSSLRTNHVHIRLHLKNEPLDDKLMKKFLQLGIARNQRTRIGERGRRREEAMVTEEGCDLKWETKMRKR